MNTIAIRAINPDNDRELRSLIKLFSRVYPAGYPTNCVYDLEFWRAHCGRTFTSLAAFSGKSLIGHIGLKASQVFENSMELILPAFDSATLNDMYLLAAAGQQTIAGLALRQNWNSLHCIPFSESVEYLPILTDVMGFSEAVLLTASPGSSRDAVPAFWWKSLKQSDARRMLYVPEYLGELVRELNNELQLKERHCCFNHFEPDRPNIIASDRHRLGSPRVYIEQMEALSDGLAPRCLFPRCDKAYLAVNASRPTAIGIVEALFKRGYLFAGLLPDCVDNDQLIFVSSHLSTSCVEERFSRSGKLLANSLQRQYAIVSAAADAQRPIAIPATGFQPSEVLPDSWSTAAG